MRVDKWLWAARFFKTRSIASHACELGRVELNAKPVKPAREVKPGDMLKVRTPGGDFEVEVLLLIQMRGPAPVAQTMYRETETSVEARRLKAEERKLGPDLDWIPEGRPNKKDRRAINRLRGR